MTSVSNGMYQKGLSCTIAWYILGCSVYVLVCTACTCMYSVYMRTEGNNIQLSTYSALSAAGMSMWEVSQVLIKQDTDKLDRTVTSLDLTLNSVHTKYVLVCPSHLAGSLPLLSFQSTSLSFYTGMYCVCTSTE